MSPFRIDQFGSSTCLRVTASFCLRNIRPLVQIHVEPGGLVIDDQVAEFDPESAVFFIHGLGGVGTEVHDNLVHLSGIGQNQAGIILDVGLKLNGCRYGCPQQFQCLFYQRSDMDR